VLEYDPDKHIDPEEWLERDEAERLSSVVRYHERKRIPLPNIRVHGAMHVIVENQIAMGDTYPAQAALSRLMDEGLDRHEAVHAIASLVSEELFLALKSTNSGTDLNAQYLEKLKRLTVEDWRKQYSEEAE
jgi:hypothetical protein